MKRSCFLLLFLAGISGGVFCQSLDPVRSNDRTSPVELVINEFMASNVATVQDQDGEYDDWIELYNNGTSAVSLDGFNISDKPDHLDKWTFPDTTIAAGAYVILWCDEDSSQAGLHANFKLSSLGEQIILSDPSLNTIDQVTFGLQRTDTSTGRFPNGTGPFILMRPTFGSENVNGFPTAVNEPAGIPHVTLGQNFPNPVTQSASIPVTLAATEHVKLEIRDLCNRPVTVLYNGGLPAGEHIFLWEPGPIAPGIYICILTTRSGTLQKKMIVGKK